MKKNEINWAKRTYDSLLNSASVKIVGDNVVVPRRYLRDAFSNVFRAGKSQAEAQLQLRIEQMIDEWRKE